MPNKASRKRRKRRKVEHIHIVVNSVELDAAMAELLEELDSIDGAEPNVDGKSVPSAEHDS